MKKIKVEVLGVSLEADLLNYKVARSYEEGLEKVVETAEQAAGCKTGSEGIELECKAVIGFIDDIFGQGSAKKVLGEETDLLTCLDAWEELTELYEKQVNPMLEERNRKVLESLQVKHGDA